jgi:polyisoprenyl-phosphate glycosyltransferase
MIISYLLFMASEHTNQITAIIPCYNEKDRVNKVVSVLLKSSYIAKVIAVDDGSTDGTGEVLNEFHDLLVVTLAKNSGKGEAIRKGLEVVTTPYVFLCDADLSGLTDHEIGKMTLPTIDGVCDICVGVRFRGGKIVQFARKNIFPLIAGERVMKTDLLRSIASSVKFQGWGVEIYMNYFARTSKLKIMKVDLVGVRDPFQIKKRGFFTYIKRLFLFCKIYWDVYTSEL